jgi:hypothetical protein
MRRGQALIEAIVAISVLTVGFLGLITLLSQSLGLSRVSAEQYVAAHLASEGIEVTRNLLDAELIQRVPWGTGFPDGDYELDYASDWNTRTPVRATGRFISTDVDGRYGYDLPFGAKQTPFIRTITISRPQGDNTVLKVRSVVRWSTRGGGTFDVAVEDFLYHWR